MMFMVIERFKDGCGEAVYERFAEKGRMLPDGLRYVGSWIETTLARCFQVMECDDPRLFDEWTAHWSDLVDFEIVPVITSEEARARKGDSLTPR